MIFPQGFVALVASASVVSAAPGLFKRQSTSCSSSYACPFQINVGGCGTSQITDGQIRTPVSSISEISDGQTRCNVTGAPPTNFTLSNGQVTDSAGRLCEISKQNQFQCSAMVDAGATTKGFSVCSGQLNFNNNASFVACLATGDIPGYNIYTGNVDKSTVTNCTAVQLTVPACAVSSSSSSCVPSTVTSTVVSTNVPAAVTVVQTTTAAPVTVNHTLTAPAVTISQTQTQTQTQTAAPVTVIQTTTAAPVTVNQTITAPAVTIVQTQTQSRTQTQVQTQIQSAAPVTVVQTQTAAPVTIVHTQTLPAVTVNQTITAPAVTLVHTQTATITSTQTQPITVVQTQPTTVTVVTTVPTTVQAPATTLKVTTTSSSAQATCTNITRSLGSANFPNTIEVVKSGSDLSGSSYFGNIGNGNSTIFTFNPTGKTGDCSLSFYFPTTAEIVAQSGTTAYEISSSSIAVTLYELAAVAPVTSTYANKPARGAAHSATLTPGQNTTFSTFTCPTVQTSYELTATDSNTLNFFADYNLPVLSLVIASCN